MSEGNGRVLFRFEAEILPDVAKAFNKSTMQARSDLEALSKMGIEIPSLNEARSLLRALSDDAKYGVGGYEWLFQTEVGRRYLGICNKVVTASDKLIDESKLKACIEDSIII